MPSPTLFCLLLSVRNTNNSSCSKVVVVVVRYLYRSGFLCRLSIRASGYLFSSAAHSAVSRLGYSPPEAFLCRFVLRQSNRRVPCSQGRVVKTKQMRTAITRRTDGGSDSDLCFAVVKVKGTRYRRRGLNIQECPGWHQLLYSLISSLASFREQVIERSRQLGFYILCVMGSFHLSRMLPSFGSRCHAVIPQADEYIEL